ncbi:MAG TPA: hypothetical protein VKY19_12095 [Ktedonosporobacter sp.]|jgi:hypothetical protein|nr:hypothetical protein [Ktedonosporobacter sp.]
MQLRAINLSFVVVDIEEAAVLRRKLVERTYTPAIASHISGILQQLTSTNTLELGGMPLVTLNAVLNDIIADSSTTSDDIMKLQQVLHKVQIEVINRYNEITGSC